MTGVTTMSMSSTLSMNSNQIDQPDVHGLRDTDNGQDVVVKCCDEEWYRRQNHLALSNSGSREFDARAGETKKFDRHKQRRGKY